MVLFSLKKSSAPDDRTLASFISEPDKRLLDPPSIVPVTLRVICFSESTVTVSVPERIGDKPLSDLRMTVLPGFNSPDVVNDTRPNPYVVFLSIVINEPFHGAKNATRSIVIMSGERESNPRPLPWQGSVLSLNYPRNICEVYQKDFPSSSISIIIDQQMQLYNSLSQTKDTFKSLKKNEVSMYVCGITPYDTTHLGHAFTYLTFDILQRYLTYKGYTVTYTQNVTDIDDDILKKAKEVGRDWQELGEWWTNKFLNDLNAMNIIMPTYYVKATDTIDTIKEIIGELVTKNFAYEKEGNVYFRVSKDPEYGKLSRYSRDEMMKLSKERGANPSDPLKEDPLDFILWQKSTPDEPSWDSSWSKGRPGWHIECSAMVYKYLDKNIDIHGGGIDLIYPHHESEIAQSESFTGINPFVSYWMHTGAVKYEGEKMSKSIGNLVMVSDLLKKYSADVIRFALLMHHYRQPWEFDHEELDEAKKKIELIESALALKTEEQGSELKNMVETFTSALDDDLNTPEALIGIINLAKETLKEPTKTKQQTLHDMVSLLGFRQTK